MRILQGAIVLFCLFESANVVALYTRPTFPYANAMGCFQAWERSQQEPDVAIMVRYLACWVAGVKVFLMLVLLTIALVGSLSTLRWTAVACIVGIATYYGKLHPLMVEMHRRNALRPAGYHRTLAWMIAAMMGLFILAWAGSFWWP